MYTKDLILQEIDQIPEFLLDEVLDFLQFLKTKYTQEKLEVSTLSETALAKDWLSPEEEDAWRDL